MRLKDRRRISRTILTALPDLHEAKEGRLLVCAPIGHILRGFCIEDSSDPSGVYLWAFVQPLYVPASTVVLNLAKRLGSSRIWRPDEEVDIDKTARAGSLFYANINSPESLANWPELNQRTDEYSAEAKAYSLLLCGRTAEGIAKLNELTKTLSSTIKWMQDLRVRDEQLATLSETDPEAAIELLSQWEQATIDALAIDR